MCLVLYGIELIIDADENGSTVAAFRRIAAAVKVVKDPILAGADSECYFPGYADRL